MRRFLRDQGLALAMFGIFALAMIGLVFSGWSSFNRDQSLQGEPEVGLPQYLVSAEFGEAVFENWESEFLQMGAYILLTAVLFSRGSAESRNPDHRDAQDADPRLVARRRNVPWPVKRGGLALVLYENSLTIVLLALFVASFVMHAATGAAAYSHELERAGVPGVSLLGYLGTSRFWFESLQNWQSEFLSVGALIVLSIFLRQRGSPGSKPVAAPNAQTGG